MDSDRHQAAVSSRNEWLKLNCDGGLAGLSLVVIPFYFVVFWGGGERQGRQSPRLSPWHCPVLQALLQAMRAPHSNGSLRPRPRRARPRPQPLPVVHAPFSRTC